MIEFKKGSIVTFTHGEYSDYGFSGPFTVMKDFDTSIFKTFLTAWRPKSEWEKEWGPNKHDFIGWLVTEGFIEDATGHEWYLGSYNLEPEFCD